MPTPCLCNMLHARQWSSYVATVLFTSTYEYEIIYLLQSHEPVRAWLPLELSTDAPALHPLTLQQSEKEICMIDYADMAGLGVKCYSFVQR